MRKSRKLSETNSESTIAEKFVDSFLHDFLKSYIYGVYAGKMSDSNITVIRCVAPTELFSNKSKAIVITDDKSGNFFRVQDSKVLSTIKYKNALYDISLYWVNESRRICFYVYVYGLTSESCNASELLEYLTASALKHSYYNNEFLTFYTKYSETVDIPEISILPHKNYKDSLSGVFLSDKVQRQIDLFVKVLKNYSSINQSLRYLFSGKPGTGKTKIIRAIANECRGNATFVFTTGSEENLGDLFDLVKKFSPVVLCIDDVDMLTGSRNEGMHTRLLAKFLQELDGINRNDFFVLATTNDKRLVDLAASRPGRFDSVIDVSEIHPNQYLQLVRSQTKRQEIIEFFNEEVLDILETKKVTGAFIVNLVKQFELNLFFSQESITSENIVNFIKETYNSFYKEPLSEKSYGFSES